MARPPHARQHPTVQADLAQAQAVVAAAEGRSTQPPAQQSSGTSGNGTSRPAATTSIKVSGTAADPRVKWKDNPPGTPVRTIKQAEVIAKENGIKVPSFVRFKTDKHAKLPANVHSRYGPDFRGDPRKPIFWKAFFEPDGTMTVVINENTLNSDEGIISVFNHEMHEVIELERLFKEIRGSMPLGRLNNLINSENGTIHEQAWTASDRMLLDRRAKGLDATIRQFTREEINTLQ